MCNAAILSEQFKLHICISGIQCIETCSIHVRMTQRMLTQILQLLQCHNDLNVSMLEYQSKDILSQGQHTDILTVTVLMCSIKL